jgi:hypothetical protein
MDGGMLAVGARGTMTTVWRRYNEVFSAPATGGREQLLGRGEQPWIASTATGPVVVWTAAREGDLLMQPASAKTPKKLASAARDPVVVSEASGQGPVIACWESRTNGQPSVLALQIVAARSAR